MIELEKFKCGICGREWDTPIEQAYCIMECDKIQKIKAEHTRIERLKTEEKKRIAEIQEAFNGVVKLIKAFKSDYHKPIPINIESGDVLYPLLTFFDLMKL